MARLLALSSLCQPTTYQLGVYLHWKLQFQISIPFFYVNSNSTNYNFFNLALSSLCQPTTYHLGVYLYCKLPSQISIPFFYVNSNSTNYNFLSPLATSCSTTRSQTHSTSQRLTPFRLRRISSLVNHRQL